VCKTDLFKSKIKIKLFAEKTRERLEFYLFYFFENRNDIINIYDINYYYDSKKSIAPFIALIIYNQKETK